MPGVVAVITDDPRLPREAPPFGEPVRRVDGILTHFGEVVGLVVAESFEQARAAALAATVAVDAGTPETDPLAHLDRARSPSERTMLPDRVIGDLDAAMANAAATLDVTYTTPHQVHAALEPHAAVASWEGDRCTIHGRCRS
jgi:xanthine dehydrogenase YagR molybdenum-binding subunit